MTTKQPTSNSQTLSETPNIPDFTPDVAGADWEYNDLPRTQVSDAAEQNIILWDGNWFELPGDDGKPKDVCSVAYSLEGMSGPTATFLAGGVLAKQLQERNFPLRVQIKGQRSKTGRAYWSFIAPVR